MLALCKTRKVTYTALAIAFDNKTCKDSNVKRIRNFMKAANFTAAAPNAHIKQVLL